MLRECLSEFLGTYLLVLIGPATIVLVSLVQGIGALMRLAIVGLSFGGTVAAIILSLGKYSAHTNPAVTAAHFLARAMQGQFLLPYIGVQFLGGLLAGLTLRVTLGSLDSETRLGSTKLGPGIDPLVAILLEAAGTIVLSLAAVLATTRVRRRRDQAFIVGVTLFVLIMLLGSLTGASFNPARSFGPSFASGYFVDQYVYWIGPVSGGVIGALIFNAGRFFRGRLGRDSFRLR